jgi:hypothetical protein
MAVWFLVKYRPNESATKPKPKAPMTADILFVGLFKMRIAVKFSLVAA